jgi:Flp pilus assembly protein TadG
MRDLLGRFLQSSGGSFVPILALTLVPLVLAVGLATDYGRGVSTQVGMQDALDAATVSLTTLPQTATDTQRQQLLQQSYAANGGSGTATLNSATFDADGTLHLSSSASYSMPTDFMKLAMVTSVPIDVTTAMVKSPSLIQATFGIQKASGYWSKTITLYGTQFGASSANPMMKIVYTYNGAGGSKGYGTTTVETLNSAGKYITAQQQVCKASSYNSRKGVPSGSFLDGNVVETCTYTAGSATSGATIDVSQMQDLYLEMDVPSGTPSVLKSNDPTTSNRLYIDGTEVATGQPVDIFSAVPCGQTSQQAWEDGGSPVPGPVANADFFYTVTGKCDYSQRMATTRFTQ